MAGRNKVDEKKVLIQEKCQAILNQMLVENFFCADCDSKGPRWASWNLGIFLCIRCAGIHRNLGVHISRVKSVNLDTWTPEQVVTMQQMGNSRARAVYEATMPDNFRRPQTDVTLESFIRAKYEHKKYIAQEWVKPVLPPINWDSEIEESLRKKKEAKKQGASENITLPSAIPKPKSSTVSSGIVKKLPSPATVAAAQSTSTTAANPTDTVNDLNGKAKNPSDDLLGLMTHEESSNLGSLMTDPFASPIKSTTTPNANLNSAAHDLGSIFISSDPSTDNNSQKMTKESILSLYGQGSTGSSVNPFTSPPMYSSQGAPPPLGNPGGNPFPQYASPLFNPNLMGQQQGGMNPYSGNHANSNLHTATSGTTDPNLAGMNNLFNFQTDVSQIQQQMYGIQLSFNNVPHNNASMNTGNNLIGNYHSQVGQTGGMQSGLQSFLPPTANTATFQSPVGQTKNPGPFF